MGCKCTWKKDKEIKPTILIDIATFQVATFKMCECLKCGKREERIDRRTITKLSKKYCLYPKNNYLVQGKNGQVVPWSVKEKSLLVLTNSNVFDNGKTKKELPTVPE